MLWSIAAAECFRNILPVKVLRQSSQSFIEVPGGFFPSIRSCIDTGSPQQLMLSHWLICSFSLICFLLHWTRDWGAIVGMISVAFWCRIKWIKEILKCNGQATSGEFLFSPRFVKEIHLGFDVDDSAWIRQREQGKFVHGRPWEILGSWQRNWLFTNNLPSHSLRYTDAGKLMLHGQREDLPNDLPWRETSVRLGRVHSGWESVNRQGWSEGKAAVWDVPSVSLGDMSR